MFMKKAKIVLAAVAIFAVIGGAFAFKSQRALKPLFQEVNGLCTLPVNTSYTTVLADAIDPTPYTTLPYYTIAVQAPCPPTTFYRAN